MEADEIGFIDTRDVRKGCLARWRIGCKMVRLVVGVEKAAGVIKKHIGHTHIFPI